MYNEPNKTIIEKYAPPPRDRAPSVDTFGKRKRYIDYALYLKLRGKIETG